MWCQNTCTLNYKGDVNNVNLAQTRLRLIHPRCTGFSSSQGPFSTIIMEIECKTLHSTRRVACRKASSTRSTNYSRVYLCECVQSRNPFGKTSIISFKTHVSSKSPRQPFPSDSNGCLHVSWTNKSVCKGMGGDFSLGCLNSLHEQAKMLAISCCLRMPRLMSPQRVV